MSHVRGLKGVGPKLEARLARLNIFTLSDLLLHLPARYQDRTRVVPIAELRPGLAALVEGRLVDSQLRGGRRRQLLLRLADAGGELWVRFFHFSAGQRDALVPGSVLRCYGEVRNTLPGAVPEMTHPELQRVSADGPPPCPELTPVYPTTDGLHQTTLRGLVGQCLALLDGGSLPELSDHLPPAVRKEWRLPELPAALRLLHRPPPAAAAELLAGRHPAQRRLALEELLGQQLGLRRLRLQTRDRPAPALTAGAELRQALLDSLAFRLTAAQRRVSAEIVADLSRPRPMLRLVQGDVGSGKTVVATLAALTAAAGGKQTALMAPTELLSEQHYRTLSRWLAPLGVKVVWLTGRLPAAARRTTLTAIADGIAAVAVGTHALFQETVSFHDLALVIVDEQHRFGVHQRLALRAKGDHPHQLVMTATPIPRTLAMSVYADLDTSVIDQLPPGRTPVTTVAVAATRRAEVAARIAAVCAQGRQAYWVCTLVEESELLQAQAAEQTAADLGAALPQLRVGLIHGRLSGEVKEQVMASFQRRELDILVATTVIEVGVDVPNASLMIIENPERLGLAQLHQLRGRVGRGSVASHCVLLYQPPLSAAGRAKLGVLRDTNDGFLIAERDLELRGPGEVLGARQTGELSFRVADLRRDQRLLLLARELADRLLVEHPDRAEAIIHRLVPASQRDYGFV